MLSVLFLAANPAVPRLSLENEYREIQQIIQLGTRREQFVPHVRTDVRWSDLSQAIVTLKPTILHFSGHGLPGGRMLLSDDARDTASEVPLTALRKLLGAVGSVRLLVMNACHTGDHGEAFLDVVEHVVAMRGDVSDRGASVFAQGFYRSLTCGNPVDVCFGVGSAEIEARSTYPGDTEQPVLMKRPGCRQDLGIEPQLDGDPLIARLQALSTRRNVFAHLTRSLPDQLADLFPYIEDVINVVTQADVLVQQAGARIPSPFTGHGLRIGRVPLQAGAHRAWRSALQDASAISPFALFALLLVAHEQRPQPWLEDAIGTIGRLAH